MVGELEFERPIVQLRNKIVELKEFTKTSELDLSTEIEKLEARLEKLEKDIYENLMIHNLFTNSNGKFL